MVDDLPMGSLHKPKAVYAYPRNPLYARVFTGTCALLGVAGLIAGEHLIGIILLITAFITVIAQYSKTMRCRYRLADYWLAIDVRGSSTTIRARIDRITSCKQ